MRAIDIVYWNQLRWLMAFGDFVRPRGMVTREARAVKMVIDPNRAILASPARRLNYAFSVAEWLWIMLGRTDVASIAPYNSNVAAFSDDGETFAGAYGAPVAAQLDWVIQQLQRDPDTRQAVLTIWRPMPAPSKDIPCTIALQFLLRGGRLELIVTMRSNDIWLGLPYDVFTFTQIQRVVATTLGVGLGPYTHIDGSLHLYEQHFDAARELIDMGPMLSSTAPPVGPWPFDVDELGRAFDHVTHHPKAGGYDILHPHNDWAVPYLRLLREYRLKGESRYRPEPWRSLYLARSK